MKKNLYKILTYITILILAATLVYKVYLSLYESNFQDSNYENTKLIEAIPPQDTFSFAVVGSAQNSIDVFQNEIIPDINSDPDILFTVSSGNAVMNGSEDKYRILNKSLERLHMPKVVGFGHNEASDGGDKRFFKHFGQFYFSFPYNDSYFIFIDTTGVSSINPQKDWLLKELKASEDYANTFVFMDSSPVDFKASDFDIKNTEFCRFLVDEFSAHNVTGVFVTGSLIHEKSVVKNVPYYSSGGAGGLFLKSTKDGFYHYLKVTVSTGFTDVVEVQEPWISNSATAKKLENLWIYIHSFFYAQFVNLLVFILLILLLFLILYKKASKPVNYYRDFSLAEENIDMNQKLKIAMFTNNYLPFIGGVPISINRLATALRENGHKVVIFAPKYEGANDSNDDVVRCKLLFTTKNKKINYCIPNIFSRKIRNEFVKGNFDIVHVHHPFWMGRVGLNLGKKNNIPVVLTYHTRLEMYSDNLPVFKLLFKNVLSHSIIKDFSQKCDAIIAPTLSAKEYLENVGISRQKLVLPTGVDFKTYDTVEKTDVENIRSRYAPHGETLLCSVSRLSVEKNLGFLIQGLKTVKETTAVKFKCMIIGSGPEQEHLQKLIDECSLNADVVFVGSVNPKDISKYYLASDLFVFSSLSETQGMVLLEAMAGGCPVVCVRSSGTDDVIRDGYNGYKTPCEILPWSDKVLCLLEDKTALETMSENALLYAQNYSLEKMAEQVEIFYKKNICSHMGLSKGE